MRRVPTILLPSRVKHAKLDDALFSALGQRIPWQCRWNENDRSVLESIEFEFPEDAEFTERDVHEVVKNHQLEPDEKCDHQEGEESRKERELSARERKEFREKLLEQGREIAALKEMIAKAGRR